MPYTPKAVKSAWTNQTIRLAVSSNKRLKRAALKKKMSFNAWAVQILTEAADAVLNPNALEESLERLRDLAEQAEKRNKGRKT